MYANFLNKPLFWGVPTDHREGQYSNIIMSELVIFKYHITILVGKHDKRDYSRNTLLKTASQ